MITINDFQILPFNKQCDFITVFADYLIYRVEGEQKYYLYYMGEFFVEVSYTPSEGKVNDIRAFKDIKQLAPYLTEINISALSVN